MKRLPILVSILVLTAIAAFPANGQECVAASTAVPRTVSHLPRAANKADAVAAALKDPKSEYVVVVSHRGDWRNYPENSLPAIESVIRMGVDMMELDLKKTKDGVLVLMHDGTLNRTSTGKGKVSDYTWEELQEFDLKRAHGIAIPGLKIPTLRQALEVCKDRIAVNVDQGYEFYDEVLAIAEELGVTDQLLIKGGYPWPDVQRKLGEHPHNLMYMPVVGDVQDGESELFKSYVSAEQPQMAYELCFNELNGNVRKAARKVLDSGSKVWVNTIWGSLCGEHDDDKAYDAADPDTIYGPILELGTSIIQTDRPEFLIRYLERKGRRNKAQNDIAGHVIVLGLDGWGTWSFEKGDTPFIREMMKEGSYTLYKRTVLPSISGANWAAMMNGTPAESSGIIGNNAAPYFKPLVLTEHNAQPTFFHLLKQARPEAETGVVCEWGDFLNYADTLCLDHFQRIQDPTGHPDAIVEESVKYIKEKKPVLCFIHIDALDHVGHAHGQGSAEYYAELPLVDDRVRRIVEGVKEAGIYDDSIIFISSDHGHEGTGHGGHALNEIETPLVVWGKGIKKNHEITETVIQYDLAATVAEVFHLEKPQSWRGVCIPVFE